MAATPSHSQSGTKERIIRAAEDLVIRDGVSKLTIEAAANEAGLSKGGVLYHFPSRDALVSAMLARFVESFDEDLEHHGALGDQPGDFTRAYVVATLEPTDEPDEPDVPDEPDDVRDRSLSGALLAGMASDPRLLAPLRERFDHWQARIERDGLDPAIATLLRLAADGIWLSDLFGVAPVHGELRKRVGEALARLLEDSIDAGPGRGKGAQG